jgi:formate-nitrite transporter family protein
MPALLRLWVGTLITNLLAGWIFTWLIILAVPQVRSSAIKVGTVFVSQGISGTSFASALLGGAIITLMTWMQHSSEAMVGKLVAAFSAGFLLASGHLNHAIVASLEMFAALHAGAGFGYWVWFRLMLWASLGNIIGGIAFVTILRLVQVGGDRIKLERRRASEEQAQQQEQDHQERAEVAGVS